MRQEESSLSSLPRRLCLTALLGIGTATVGGCVIIVPAIPATAPGYGRRYHVIDQRGRPVEAGALLLTFVYPMSGGDLINCYDIDRGRVNVPAVTAVRYSGSLWGAIYLPIPLGYFGRSQNPKFTSFHPIVPGYVQAGWPHPAWDTTTADGSAETPGVFHLMPVDPPTEVRYLHYLVRYLGDDPPERIDNRRGWERALALIRHRLAQLPATRPPTSGARATSRPRPSGSPSGRSGGCAGGAPTCGIVTRWVWASRCAAASGQAARWAMNGS